MVLRASITARISPWFLFHGRWTCFVRKRLKGARCSLNYLRSLSPSSCRAWQARLPVAERSAVALVCIAVDAAHARLPFGVCSCPCRCELSFFIQHGTARSGLRSCRKSMGRDHAKADGCGAAILRRDNHADPPTRFYRSADSAPRGTAHTARTTAGGNDRPACRLFRDCNPGTR